MNSPLLNQLIEDYEADPNDAFNIYALATEYQKTDIQKALQLFTQLVTTQPNYVATYYHLGKLQEQLGNRDEAMAIYEKGIMECTQQKAHHALKELGNAYNELMFE